MPFVLPLSKTHQRVEKKIALLHHFMILVNWLQLAMNQLATDLIDDLKQTIKQSRFVVRQLERITD
ncbi:MAG: hypothetical protein ABFS39_11220 [Pseudomonadota bacterium]